MIDDSYMLLALHFGQKKNFLQQQRCFCSEKPFKIPILALKKMIFVPVLPMFEKMIKLCRMFLNRIFHFALERVILLFKLKTVFAVVLI